MKKDYFVYKTTDVYSQENLPLEYKLIHKGVEGEIENPVVLLGSLKFLQYDGEQVKEESLIEPGNYEFLVSDGIDYRYEPVPQDGQFFVQFNYFTDATDYFTKKYDLAGPNPLLIEAIRDRQIDVQNILDVNAMDGSNSLYLSLLTYPTTSLLAGQQVEDILKISEKESLTDLNIKDLNETNVLDLSQYDLLILDSADLISGDDLQAYMEHTQAGAYHLVSGPSDLDMDSIENKYRDWTIITLNQTADGYIHLLAQKN